MDGKADKTPYSIPKVYNMLVVGGDSVTPSVSSDDQLKGLVRLREGTRGEFGNVILTNVGNTGVYQDKCQSETRTHTYSQDNTLWWSANNIIYGGATTIEDFDLNDSGGSFTDCAGFDTSINNDPELIMVPSAAHENLKWIDPRPVPGGEATTMWTLLPRTVSSIKPISRVRSAPSGSLIGRSWLTTSFCRITSCPMRFSRVTLPPTKLSMRPRRTS